MESSVLVVDGKIVVAAVQVSILPGEGRQLRGGGGQPVGCYGTQNDAPKYTSGVIIILQQRTVS